MSQVPILRRSFVTVRHWIGGNADPTGLCLVEPFAKTLVAPGTGTVSKKSATIGLVNDDLVFHLNCSASYSSETNAIVTATSYGFLLEWEHPPSGDSLVDYDDAFTEVLVDERAGFFIGNVIVG